MDDGNDLNHAILHWIDQAIRRFDQLANILSWGLGHPTARVGKCLGLTHTHDNPFESLLGLHGRGHADVLDDGAELIHRRLRTAERHTHEAR